MRNKLKAIFLSNDEYGEGLNKLNGAVATTELVYNYFRENLLNESDMLFLHDVAYTEAINSINGYIKKVEQSADCIFIFYFCGHGKIKTSSIMDLVLTVKDSTSENYNSVGIKFADLLDMIKSAGIDKYIIIIDSCCSGVINLMGDGDFMPSKELLENGAVYISSTKGISSAYEINVDGQTVPCFTYYFYKALLEIQEKCCGNPYSIKDLFIKTKQLIESDNQTDMIPQITDSNMLINRKIFNNKNVDTNNFDNVLDVVDWRITSKCDNVCEVCYAANSLKNLNEKNAQKLVEKLESLPCRTVCISGGEPTLCNYLSKVVKRLSNKGFNIYLSTNGSNFEKNRPLLEKYINKLSLPLDGYDSVTNSNNGRNHDSFENVTKILEYYTKNKPDFIIKVSTVLTSKTCEKKYLSKIFELLKKYNIDIWKIYEFIPANRGVEHKDTYTVPNTKVLELENWIKDNLRTEKFKVEFIRRKKRDSAYFIIQPNGDVVIPKDIIDGDVSEMNIGNLLNDDLYDILSIWNQEANTQNYLSNTKIRKYSQPYYLEPIDKKILYYMLSNNEIPSFDGLMEAYKEYDRIQIKKHLDLLYEYRIIKNIIPIVNIKRFGINTYLATLKFKQNSVYPEGHIESYLCYNANIGWISECYENVFRIAIFAENRAEASQILEKIKDDLNDEMDYGMYELKCSYSIDEKILSTNTNEANLVTNIQDVKYNSRKENNLKTSLSTAEFNILRQIESLRKPTKENINRKMFVDQSVDVNKIVEQLKKDGIIEQLLISLDTRLLGFDWYVVSLFVPTSIIDEVINCLRTISGITHINHFIQQDSKMNLDFEVHVSSYSEIDKILQKLDREFDNLRVSETLRIKKECKFSFLTYAVSDIIYKKYTSPGNY